MATSKNIHLDRIYDKITNIAGNTIGQVYIDKPYHGAFIFVCRASSNIAGLYITDGWGGITPLVAATGITMTKAADSNLITVNNSNSIAVDVQIFGRIF